jgi:hypothetical protein
MVQEIGDSAGKLWHYLEVNPLSTVDEASKSLKLKENVVAMAAGWLAREGKLDFQLDGKIVRLQLKSSACLAVSVDSLPNKKTDQ